MASQLENKFVIRSISKLYLNPDLADFKFLFKSEEVPAHKNILAVASPVFNAMFYGPLKEADKVEIKDATVDGFKEFLQFFYLSEVTLTMDKIEEVARLADKYDMLECLNTCASFLESKLTKDTMFWGYQLAISLDNGSLKQFCETNIGLHALETFKSESFLRCDQKVLRNILMIDSLLCDENDIFNACLAWAKHACKTKGLDDKKADNLRKQLGDCFRLIRFGTIPSDIFANHISSQQIKNLFSRDELAEILCTTSIKHYKPVIFGKKPRSTVGLWSKGDPLICDRVKSSFGGDYVINVEESIWFSTNLKTILGEIHLVDFTNQYNNYYDQLPRVSNSKMIIAEVNPQTFNTIKVHFTKEVSIDFKSKKIVLSRPLIVEPQKIYEIRFENASDNDFYHTSLFEDRVEINNELTVIFHKKPNPHNQQYNRYGSNNTNSSGFISKLYFGKM